ncbi:MAG: GtrA family protein [Eubacteriales bacterium]|jgi:putative flippase GtrA
MFRKLICDERVRKIARYVFFGVCTTLVNFLMFALLKDGLHIELNVSNAIAVATSILFAYVTNKIFVFRSKTENFGALVKEMISFFSARGVTMLIEIGAIFLIHTVLHLDEKYSFYSKGAVNVVVLILNFVFSQWIVFRNKSGKQENV